MHGAVLLRLLEEVAHARGADADEHLDEVRARDREERHAGLAGDGAGQQRLAGPGRPVQQHALGDPGAERLELLRVLEELLDLVQLLDGLVDAGDVAEADLRRVGGEPLGARLAERHDLRAAALEVVHQQEPEPEEQDERQQVQEQRRPGARALRDDVVLDPVRRLRAVGHDRLQHRAARVVADRVLRVVGQRDVDRVVGRIGRPRLDLAGLAGPC